MTRTLRTDSDETSGSFALREIGDPNGPYEESPPMATCWDTAIHSGRMTLSQVEPAHDSR